MKTLEEKRAYHRDYMKRYYRSSVERRDKARAKTKQWAINNPERLKAYWKQYNKDHRKQKNAYNIEYNKLHPEKAAEWAKRWQSKNREAIKATKRRYYRNNRAMHLNKLASRRSKMRGAFVQSCADRIALLKKTARFCKWCCIRLTDENFSVDHVVAIARGGKHEPDNVVACCRRCNSSKGDRPLHVWLPTVIQF